MVFSMKLLLLHLLLATTTTRRCGAYELRPASNEEIMARYSPLEVCLIAFLAAHESCTLSSERKRELMKLQKLPHCARETAQTAFDKMSKVNTKSLGGYRGELRMNNRSDSCGMSHIDRVPLWTSAWDLPPSSHRPAAMLAHALTKYHITHLTWFGDSVMGQVQDTLKHTWSLDRNEQKRSISIDQIFLIPCGLRGNGEWAKRVGPPHLIKCTDDVNANYILNQLTSALAKANNATTVAIFGLFGAHAWPPDKQWVQGIAKGLLLAAAAARALGSIVLVLESPAQGFVYDFDEDLKHIKNLNNGSGLYLDMHYNRIHVSGPCCSTPTNHEEGNFRNIVLKAALSKEDPKWHEKIGWARLYELTTAQGAHTDIKGDCTHLAYIPFMLDPMWLDIAQDIERLMPQIHK